MGRSLSPLLRANKLDKDADGCRAAAENRDISFQISPKGSPRGRSLSPLFRKEFANLDKDASSRRSAIKALKSYVKELDSKAIPHFLAEVSETKVPGSSPGECTISLYEVLARVHGRKIVPQIENIMSTIMCTLSSSVGSFPLHQACSRVVPAIARYGIDPSTPADEKTRIISSLCKPLCDVLMLAQESTSSGAALCLKALVEADNWRFASDDLVNQVCLKVAGALEEKATQTNYHMGLVMALAKHSSLISEAYARSFLRSGLQILTAGPAESNSQKRLSAIQMINSLMKYVDQRSISSELVTVVEVMENCQSDQMEFVRRAALESSHVAKIVAAQKGSRQGTYSSPSSKSTFDRRNDKSIWDGSSDNGDTIFDGSPTAFTSPESHTVDSFIGYDTTDSPVSNEFDFDYARPTNRRLWDNDFDAVNVSLKDGLFLKACSDCDDSLLDSEQHRRDEAQQEHSETFTGFVKDDSTSKSSQSPITSPQRSHPHLTIDGIKLHTTPRKLIRSIQDPINANSFASVLTHPISNEVEQNSVLAPNGDSHSHNMDYKAIRSRYKNSMRMQGKQRSIHDAEIVANRTESVASTGDINCRSDLKVLCGGTGEEENQVQVKSLRRASNGSLGRGALALISGLCLVFVAIFLSAMRIDNDELYFDVVPT